MSLRPGAADTGLIPAGKTSSRLIEPNSIFRRFHNLVPTDAGGLRTVSGPIAYLYRTDGSVPGDSAISVSAVQPVIYGSVRSIGHAVVADNARELLLAHVDDQIWEFQGWNNQWRVLVGAAAASPVLVQHLWEPIPSDFPTQWIRTPKGVIILPSGGGYPIMYDGTVCLPLGYNRRPSPPVGLGPSSGGFKFWPIAGTRKLGVNDSGYALDGLHPNQDSGLPVPFKYGRLGTVHSIPITQSGDPEELSGVSGYLSPGLYRAKSQWVNHFGDLSPLSHASNDVHFDRQPSITWTMTAGFAYSGVAVDWVALDMVRKEVAWAGLRPGPEGTIGKIVWRTKDIYGKGDTEFYELPRDASVSTNAFATVPDNLTNFFPDNVPDEWLFNTPEDIDEVPHFRLGEVAFGRLFAANSRHDPGAVWVSMVGRFGTFPSRLKFYPDPEGAEVTGLKRVEGGLLLFSRSGIYMVTPNDAGDNFRSFTLDANVGCIAPSSIKTLRSSGETVWLGRDGFYSWSKESGVRFLFDAHREEARMFNRARTHLAVAEFDPRSGEYRCWVATDGSDDNNICWTYDGMTWRTRDDVRANGVVVTDDNRDLMIVGGLAEVSGNWVNGVWVLDKSGEDQASYAQTGWLNSVQSQNPISTKRVRVLLRETAVTTADADKLLVEVEHNYRVGVVSSQTVNLYPDEGTPLQGSSSNEPMTWGDATWAEAIFRARRPFWAVADIDVSSCESFRVKFSCTGRWEFIGYTFESISKADGGAKGYT